MKPAPFRYARPRGIVEAVALLGEYGARARVLAGGQSLMPLLARRLERPEWVIDINGIAGLDRIEMSATHIRMGALVRQQQALRSVLVREQITAVAEALAWVANPVVRGRGAVVGNLVTNTPGAELPAVAVALEAEFVLRYPDREETVPAARLLGAAGRVPADALVTHVLWPRRPGPAGFDEVARRDRHAPVVSAMVTRSEGVCRVAVSGVCAQGLACPSMARVIERAFPRPPDLAALAGALQEDLTGPVYGDVYSSARYRLEVAPTLSRRAAQLMVQGAAT